MDTPTPLVPAPVVPPAQVLLPAHHVRWKLISAIFVIALFAGAYIVFAKTKSIWPFVSGVSSPTVTGWKTYTNIKYGFSVQYPSDWYALTENAEIEYPQGQGPRDGDVVSMASWVSLPPPQTEKELELYASAKAIELKIYKTKESIDPDGGGTSQDIDIQQESIRVDGANGYRTIAPAENSGGVIGHQASIYFKRDDLVFGFLTGNNFSVGAVQIMDQMISTFKFTDTASSDDLFLPSLPSPWSTFVPAPTIVSDTTFRFIEPKEGKKYVIGDRIPIAWTGVLDTDKVSFTGIWSYDSSIGITVVPGSIPNTGSVLILPSTFWEGRCSYQVRADLIRNNQVVSSASSATFCLPDTSGR